MKKILFVFAFMLILLMVGNAEAITCTATPSSTTIDLGSSKKVTISCTDWGASLALLLSLLSTMKTV